MAHSAHRGGAESAAPRPRVLVEELLAAKATPVIVSVDDLAVDMFGAGDAELEDFLAVTRAERHRGVS